MADTVVPAPYSSPVLSAVDQGKLDIVKSNARIQAILDKRAEDSK